MGAFEGKLPCFLLETLFFSKRVELSCFSSPQLSFLLPLTRARVRSFSFFAFTSSPLVRKWLIMM